MQLQDKWVTKVLSQSLLKLDEFKIFFLADQLLIQDFHGIVVEEPCASGRTRLLLFTDEVNLGERSRSQQAYQINLVAVGLLTERLGMFVVDAK